MAAACRSEYLSDRKVKRSVCGDCRQKLVLLAVPVGSFAVSAEAGWRVTNEQQACKQQGTERHVRDCLSREQQRARLEHRSAENIQRGRECEWCEDTEVKQNGNDVASLRHFT
ncbi:hypothetical protein OJAV_G00102980 [Oryzias javanicus]|uniref:Uncharacterized protein n=1 Tax=Oryzias javanicus TaxID=123683 RepID=A0A3S2Q1R7_ORYJA|nr:hypothetical protein OJAV_G00102980 [Oryzias javanicus]